MSGSNSNIVAYDPNNVTQQSFLAGIRQAETGTSGMPASNLNLGTLGAGDVGGYSLNQYGFPNWSSVPQVSHGTGYYQFEPGTWSSVASQYGLNFQSAQDQSAGAWYLAQETYARNTGGGSLQDALSSGDYSSVQSALNGTWATAGNSAEPQGLASYLSSNPTVGSQYTGASVATDAGSTQSTGVTSGSATGGSGDNLYYVLDSNGNFAGMQYGQDATGLPSGYSLGGQVSNGTGSNTTYNNGVSTTGNGGTNYSYNGDGTVSGYSSPATSTGTAANTSSSGSGSSSILSTSFWSDLFTRGGLIFIGAILILVALWWVFWRGPQAARA